MAPLKWLRPCPFPFHAILDDDDDGRGDPRCVGKMDGSTSEIEELSKMAERKLSIRSSNDPRLGGGLQLHNPSSFSSSSSSALVNVLQRLDQIDLRVTSRHEPSHSESIF